MLQTSGKTDDESENGEYDDGYGNQECLAGELEFCELLFRRQDSVEG
jgi:hypothetical protein